MSTLTDQLMAWLAARPLRTRVRIYDTVLWTAALLAAASWGLPLVDVDHIWRIDLVELGKISIATSAAAALLAKANARPGPRPPAVDQN